MRAALSLGDAATLCRDSLDLADAIELAGGPPPHRSAEFYRARAMVENAQSELQSNDLGILPLAIIPWLLLGAGTIVGVATIPAAISGTKQVVGATTGAVAGVARTVDNALRWASYAAVGAGTYWLLRTITKKTA